MDSRSSRPKLAGLGIIFETCSRTVKAVIVEKLGWKAIPLLALLLALAIVLALGTHIPAIAPFVYALF